MKKLLLTAFFALALQSCQKTVDNSDFVPGMSDVPLMPALSIVKEKSSIFDTKSGKIVEATAVGNVADKKVHKFYRDTLPHLGWAEADDMIFLKDDEQVKITTEPEMKMTKVHYYLSPSEK